MILNSVLFWTHFPQYYSLNQSNAVTKTDETFHIGELDPTLDKDLAQFFNSPEADLDLDEL